MLITNTATTFNVVHGAEPDLPFIQIKDNEIRGTNDIIIVDDNYYVITTTIRKPIEIYRDNIILDGRSDLGYFISPTISNSGILIYGEGVTVKNTKIVSAETGIYLQRTSGCTITGNYILNCERDGILLYSENTQNIITENIIDSNGKNGIRVKDTSDNNEIFGNIITNNERDGIRILDSDDNVIYQNQCIDNGNPDTRVDHQECITHSDEGIDLTYAQKSLVYQNTLTGNQHGIGLEEASRNSIHNNIIYSNTESGIHSKNAVRNNVSRNSVFSNEHYGILIEQSSYNKFSENSISDNRIGIKLEQTGYNYIFNNNFLTNLKHARYATSTSAWNMDVPIGGNYWDDYEGVDENSDGFGDTPYILYSYRIGDQVYIDEDNLDHLPLMSPYKRGVVIDTLFYDPSTEDESPTLFPYQLGENLGVRYFLYEENSGIPIQQEIISLQITSPSGELTIQDIQTGAEGYNDIVVPMDEEGSWRFDADWLGNDAYESTTNTRTIEVAQLSGRESVIEAIFRYPTEEDQYEMLTWEWLLIRYEFKSLEDNSFIYPGTVKIEVSPPAREPYNDPFEEEYVTPYGYLEYDREIELPGEWTFTASWPGNDEYEGASTSVSIDVTAASFISLFLDLELESTDDDSQYIANTSESISYYGSIRPIVEGVTVTVTTVKGEDSYSETTSTDASGRYSGVIGDWNEKVSGGRSPVGTWIWEASWEGIGDYPSSNYRANPVNMKASTANQSNPCPVVAVTYGTSMYSDVKSIRLFRDTKIRSSFTGDNFVNVFLSWYYSTGSIVVKIINKYPSLSSIVRYLFKPLILTMKISENVYDLIHFWEPLAVVLSLMTSASLCGLFYVGPFYITFTRFYSRKNSISYHQYAGILVFSIFCIILGGLISSVIINSIGITILALMVTILSATGVSKIVMSTVNSFYS
jgi:parallel beta-helix repeat protein